MESTEDQRAPEQSQGSHQEVPLPEPGPPLIPETFSAGSQMPLTKGYILNHVALQITSAAASLAFYVDFLGLSLVFVLNAGPFTAYYLGYPQETDTTPIDMMRHLGTRSGLLELILDHGTIGRDPETGEGGNAAQPPGKGNASRRPPTHGLAHLGFRVPDVGDTLRRAEEKGWTVLKRMQDLEVSNMPLPCWDSVELQGHPRPWKGEFEAAFAQIGFVQDPDGCVSCHSDSMSSLVWKLTVMPGTISRYCRYR